MNTKQFSKLLLLLCISSVLAYAILVLSKGSAVLVFEEMLTAFHVVTMLLSAMSIAMFSYLDNIAKDLTEIRNEVHRKEYSNVQYQLDLLKREVIYNGALIVLLFILERSIKGVAAHLTAQLPPQSSELIAVVSIPLRISFFVASLWAASIQLKGFLVAVGFRDVIAQNRK